MTDAERRLWQVLRGRQVVGCKFRRQHPYHDFILDFDSQRDAARDRFLRNGGFTVLLFWNHDVLTRTHDVADAIYRALSDDDRHHPHPGPPLEGEGEE